MSKFETHARKFLPIKNDEDMMAIFGDSRVFSGVVAYLKSEVDLITAKQPYALLRGKLFSHAYITTHFLSKEKHGLVLVRMLLGPNLVWALPS